jgi:murein DD-endopeptidase MepM/ murein hydrolase activator NlpD
VEWLALLALVLVGGGKKRPSTSTPDDRPPGVDAFGVPYARGSSSPAWPLRGSSSRSVSADFGDARPFGSSSPSRRHAGEDLRAPRGTDLVATEAGRVVSIDRDWYDAASGERTGVLLVELDSGIVVAYGELEPASIAVTEGQRVARGELVGHVGATKMLHLETYRSGTTRTHQWPWAGPPPAELLDPTQYLRLAAKA